MDATSVVIVVALLGSPVLGVVVSKYFRPNATPLDLLQEMQEERAEDRRRMVQVERQQRLTIDYVHQLREHIAQEKPPPPPPWPEGLNA